jgi:hypothetical protein
MPRWLSGRGWLWDRPANFCGFFAVNRNNRLGSFWAVQCLKYDMLLSLYGAPYSSELTRNGIIWLSLIE